MKCNGFQLSLFALLSILSLKSQVKDGAFTEYYDNTTQARITGSYLNGEKNGTWVDYSRDNKAETIINWKNGKRNGYFAYCYENGTVRKEGIYCNNKECGLILRI